jgi:hypothetical protein
MAGDGQLDVSPTSEEPALVVLRADLVSHGILALKGTHHNKTQVIEYTRNTRLNRQLWCSIPQMCGRERVPWAKKTLRSREVRSAVKGSRVRW